MWTGFPPPSPLGSRGSCVPATAAVARLHRKKKVKTVIPFFRSLRRKVRVSVSSCYGLSNTFPPSAYHVRRAKLRIQQSIQRRWSSTADVLSQLQFIPFLAAEHCWDWCQRGNTDLLRPRIKALKCLSSPLPSPLKVCGYASLIWDASVFKRNHS